MDIMELWSSYRKGADPEEIFSLYQECPLHEKAEGYGDVNLLHIASQNAHPEAENDMLETAYKLAMRAGAKKISALLNGTYSPDEEQSPEAQAKIATGGMTLHQACYQNQSEVVEALLKTGRVNVNAVNDDGDTPLLMVCRNQNAYLAEVLLKAGADPNCKQLDGSSPLHYAAEEGNYAIAKALLTGGADVNLRDRDGKTALILAAREG